MEFGRTTVAGPSVRPTNAPQNAGIHGRRRTLAGLGGRTELVGIQRYQRIASPTLACARARSSRSDLSTQLRQHFLLELPRSSNPKRHYGVLGRILLAKPSCAGDPNRAGSPSNRTGLERRRVRQLLRYAPCPAAIGTDISARRRRVGRQGAGSGDQRPTLANPIQR